MKASCISQVCGRYSGDYVGPLLVQEFIRYLSHSDPIELNETAALLLLAIYVLETHGHTKSDSDSAWA